MFIFEKAPFTSCHASTILEVEAGKFLAAWFGGTGEGKSDVKIWLSRMEGGKWSKPAVVAQEADFPCWNPVLFRTQAKTVLLSYKVGSHPTSWSGYLRRSTEGGQIWAASEQLPAGLLGPIKNKPIQRADGAILAGTSVESHRAWAAWVERSTDDGKTWRRFGPLAVPGRPYGIIQPTLFETKDKRIVALCRSRGIGFICQAESKDGGETWSPAKPTNLPNPNSGIDAVRSKDGDIFLVYNHNNRGRSPLNLARSTDDGKSWNKVATLEEQSGEFSYPAIIQAQDGRLHITYTWNRTHIKHVTLDPAKLKK
jgi:predicted neuraminidase